MENEQLRFSSCSNYCSRFFSSW